MSKSSTQAVHQFVPVMEHGDAIGNHAVSLRSFLRNKGVESEIFTWRCDGRMKAHCRNHTDYGRWDSPQNAVLYHFGVASPLTRLFMEVAGRKALIYHNVTPAHFFKGISDEIYYIIYFENDEEHGACRSAALG